MTAKIKAGEAQVRVSLTGSLKDGLRRASRNLARFGSQVAKIGAGISVALAGGAAASVASFARSGAELHKLSKQTGATVEELSRLQFAAKKLQIDPDDMTGAIEELNIRIGETVRDGVGPAAEAFQQLGLDAGELARMPVAERIGAISRALAGIGNNTKRGFLADEIFGGDAFKILPLIREGAEGIAALTDEADRLGATVTTSQAASAKELVDLWTNVKAAVGGLVNTIGASLTPVLLAIWDVAGPKLMEMKAFFENSGVNVFKRGVASSASAFTNVLKAFHLLKKVFAQIKWGLNSLILVAIRGFQKLVDGVGKVINAVLRKLDKIPGVKIDFRMGDDNSVSQFLDIMGDDLQRKLNKIKQDANEPFEAPEFSTNLEEAIEERQQQAEKMDKKAQEQMVKQAPSGPNFLTRYEDLWKQVQEQGAATAASFGDRFMAVMDDLNQTAVISSAGSFNATAASQLGRGGDLDKSQLETQLKMENTLAKIKGYLKDAGPLVWSV